jgi:hypothetical protein
MISNNSTPKGEESPSAVIKYSDKHSVIPNQLLDSNQRDQREQKTEIRSTRQVTSTVHQKTDKGYYCYIPNEIPTNKITNRLVVIPIPDNEIPDNLLPIPSAPPMSPHSYNYQNRQYPDFYHTPAATLSESRLDIPHHYRPNSNSVHGNHGNDRPGLSRPMTYRNENHKITSHVANSHLSHSNRMKTRKLSIPYTSKNRTHSDLEINYQSDSRNPNSRSTLRLNHQLAQHPRSVKTNRYTFDSFGIPITESIESNSSLQCQFIHARYCCNALFKCSVGVLSKKSVILNIVGMFYFLLIFTMSMFSLINLPLSCYTLLEKDQLSEYCKSQITPSSIKYLMVSTMSMWFTSALCFILICSLCGINEDKTLVLLAENRRLRTINANRGI